MLSFHFVSMNEPVEKIVIVADNTKENQNMEATAKKKFPKLQHVSWNLNVTVATNETTNIMKPHGLLYLMSEDDSTKTSRITTLDFEEEELVKFYKVLENIQQKLDEVSVK